MFSFALKTTGSYHADDVLLFEKEANFRQVAKNEVLQNKGEIAKSIFFVKKGALYQHDETKLNIIVLYIENEWLLNHKSFITQQPSDTAISAFTDCVVLEVNIEAIHYLIGRSSSFLQLGSILERSTSRVHFFDHSLTPLQKYQLILDSRPLLIQQFPLKMIASYLKVTPETLSRVREKIVKS